jgi:hypothetical protein
LAGETEVLGENLPQRHFTFFFWNACWKEQDGIQGHLTIILHAHPQKSALNFKEQFLFLVVDTYI